MDDLLADFVAETREMLEASQGEIIAWEADPSDRTRLDAIFRFVHTVKGNCGFFDFPRLEKLSHAAEDALADVRAQRRESDKALVTAILAIIDRISLFADAIEAGEDFPEDTDDALIAALAPNETETGNLTEEAPKPPLADGEKAQSGDAPKPGPATNGNATARTIRLPTELLDRVMSGVSDMVLARNDLAHRLRTSGAQPTIDGLFERLTAILADVRDAVTRMRMQKIEHLFGIFPRLVRDLSNELGKQVLVDLEGGNVELDREMVEMIRDPMTHIIRNALDHGIETPSERLKAGKRETGLLTIAARQSGNKISIVVTDDGRGLDADRIAAKALEKGITDKQTLAKMSREDILQLVFEPGLSTAKEVSNISGRGVGLDVVRDNLVRVGGSIKVTSTPGVGSLFYLSIPLTLSIIAGITVVQGEERFAIPQSYVEEIVHLDAESLDLSLVGDRNLVTFRGSRIPCISLADIFGVDHAHEFKDRCAIMLRLANGDLIAMIADKAQDISDLVVKPLPPAIMQTDLYGGSTQLEDGTPILVLDIPQIALNAGLISDTRTHQISVPDEDENASRDNAMHAMVFTGFDDRRRAIRLDLVKRIESADINALEQINGQARIVHQGQVLTVIGLDGRRPAAEVLRFLRISDGHSELAYAIKRVEDAVVLDADLGPAQGEDLVEGIAILDGGPIPVLDGFAIFARYGTGQPASTSLTCTLPDTEWAHAILAPLVTKCGYAILQPEDEAEPDLQIVMQEHADSSVESAQRIVLHDAEQTKAAPANSIYRYDENGLLSALQTARAKALKGAAATHEDDEEAA